MTDSDHEPAATVRGVAPAPAAELGVTHVLRLLAERGAQGQEPDEVHAFREGRRVEVLFHAEPSSVIVWAGLLGFAEPRNRTDDHLHQVMVEASGHVGGWLVELRHVHTATVAAGRPIHPGAAVEVAEESLAEGHP